MKRYSYYLHYQVNERPKEFISPKQFSLTKPSISKERSEVYETNYAVRNYIHTLLYIIIIQTEIINDSIGTGSTDSRGGIAFRKKKLRLKVKLMI